MSVHPHSNACTSFGACQYTYSHLGATVSNWPLHSPPSPIISLYLHLDFPMCLTHLSCRWTQQIPQKRWYLSARLKDITSQKGVIYFGTVYSL